MARIIDAGTREEWAAQNVADPPEVLLEISHSALTTPARVTAGNEDVELEGNQFIAVGAEVVLPEDDETGLPQARIAISNVGRALMEWIEATNGGHGARVKLMICSRSGEELAVEWSVSLRVSGIEVTPLKVIFTLGFADLLSAPSVATRYDSQQAPGLF